MTELLVIDGSHGEGGGQILRCSVAFSAMSGRPVRIENVRAGRRRPGLAAQHVTAIRAAGAICGGSIVGGDLGSQSLTFSPQHPVRAGEYAFDVAEAREGGSAGAASLVLQTVLMPLALANGESRVTVRGGTHMAWSPSFDYLRDVWLPALCDTGVAAELELQAWGWFPVGKGCVRATIQGEGRRRLKHRILADRGDLCEVTGRAVAANLPAHIPQRMADRARSLLAELAVPVRIAPERVRAACAGAGLFMTARYESLRCGFSALGARGRPSEDVAEEAVTELLAHWRSGAALDPHLGDQILAPLAVADGPSSYTVPRITRHLETNAWLIERFGLARVSFERNRGGPQLVTVTPRLPAG
ncbi:MAG: RNA 3'-terminal phosphate cyclase [Alphaproteobacteria bacterium]|nr:RNA 3'-terminal phosphate cyclase [Alphaproteobacteria bacterium]